MTKALAVEVPPPGPGLKTVTNAVAAAARSAPRIVAVSCPLLMKTVARLAPFQRTVELLTKSEPNAPNSALP